MSEPFIGEIVMFAGNFAPRSWAFCDGQLLPIASNTALFSILGTTYGGDGRTTFALPDLRGRIAMHPGNGPGLSSKRLGERGGAENRVITQQHMPNHTHTLRGSSGAADSDTPVDAVPAVDENGTESYSTTTVDANMAAGAIQNTGGGQSFSIQNPFNCVNFIIALQGTFPSRN